MYEPNIPLISNYNIIDNFEIVINYKLYYNEIYCIDLVGIVATHINGSANTNKLRESYKE